MKAIAKKHWPLCRHCIALWIIRVAMSVTAAASRGIGPLFPVLIILALIYFAGEVIFLYLIR